jgi:hypothetical protein
LINKKTKIKLRKFNKDIASDPNTSDEDKEAAEILAESLKEKIKIEKT